MSQIPYCSDKKIKRAIFGGGHVPLSEGDMSPLSPFSTPLEVKGLLLSQDRQEHPIEIRSEALAPG